MKTPKRVVAPEQGLAGRLALASCSCGFLRTCATEEEAIAAGAVHLALHRARREGGAAPSGSFADPHGAGKAAANAL